MKKLFKKLALCTAMAMLVNTCAPTVVPAASTGKIKKIKVTNVKNKKLTLTEGDKFKLKVKVTTKGKISKKVTFKTSSKKIAKVSKKGVITAIKPGKAKITVASKAIKKKKVTIKVTVFAKEKANPAKPAEQITKPAEETTTVAEETTTAAEETPKAPELNTSEPVVVSEADIHFDKDDIAEWSYEDHEDNPDIPYYAYKNFHFNVPEDGLYGVIIYKKDSDPYFTYLSAFKGEEEDYDNNPENIGHGYKLSKDIDYGASIDCSTDDPETFSDSVHVAVVKMNLITFEFNGDNLPDDVVLYPSNIGTKAKVSRKIYVEISASEPVYGVFYLTYDYETKKYLGSLPNGHYDISYSITGNTRVDYGFESTYNYFFSSTKSDVIVQDAEATTQSTVSATPFGDYIANNLNGILSCDSPLQVNIEGAKPLFYSFTPSETGTYTIGSTGAIDTFGVIFFDSTGDWDSFMENDDSEGSINFQITDLELTEGETYYILVRAYDNSPDNFGPAQVYIYED